MIVALLTVALVGTAPALVEPDGGKLSPVEQCFVIERGGKPVGLTRQVIRSVVRDGQPAWDIVVHQRVAAMHFDLRDHFVLAHQDLRPIAFDSRKDGVEHVALRYADGHVAGTKTEAAGPIEIDTVLPGPTWEGNLWGVTFGALPLRAGAAFTLPFYQYDQGLGAFSLKVTGSETVQTPGGPAAAWVVDAGADPAHRTTYLIGKTDGAELGTRSPGFSTRLGSGCEALD